MNNGGSVLLMFDSWLLWTVVNPILSAVARPHDNYCGQHWQCPGQAIDTKRLPPSSVSTITKAGRTAVRCTLLLKEWIAPGNSLPPPTTVPLLGSKPY